MDKRDVTIIVATRSASDLLPLPMAHLEGQTYPAARFEVVVVDYGAGAPAGDVLERYAAGAPVRTRSLALPGATSARARNLAAREAEGRWLLFLDEDLLAGPKLVEGHARAQESGGGATAALGRIELHPQVDARTFTRRFRLSPAAEAPGTPDFLDRGFHNLSIPRETFLQAGGFDEKPDFDGLQELALAWRLRNSGLAEVYALEAAAYAWRPAPFLEERRRQYLNGYSLHRALREPLPEPVRRLFPVEPRPGHEMLDRLLQPVYRHLFDPLAETTRSSEFMCERVLCYDFQRGYRDAVTGRAPRFERRPTDPPSGVHRAPDVKAPGGDSPETG